VRVECPSCHRLEEWQTDERTVCIEGGSRQPVGHPVLAAWKTLLSARSHGQVVVARCPCGQPMLASTGTAIPWTLHTVEGEFQVDGTAQSGPNGPLSDSELSTLLEKRYGWKLELKPFQALFTSTMMLSILAPAILWVIALSIVIVFLVGLVNQPGF